MNHVVDLKAYRTARAARREADLMLVPVAVWMALFGVTATMMAAPVAMAAKFALAQAEGVMAMGAAVCGRDVPGLLRG